MTERGCPMSCRGRGLAASIRLLGAVMIFACLSLAAEQTSASDLPPVVQQELYDGIEKCAAFFGTRDLSEFAPLQERALVGKDGPDVEGVYALSSGALGIRAKRVDFGGPSCKVFVTGYFDDDSAATELDAAVVNHFDGMKSLRIGSLTFEARDAFFNKVDRERLVSCIGGEERGLLGERNAINGKGSIAFISPLRGDIPC
ncbi:hypothetical protein FIU86_01030 [Roseovarius sp. THAF9]|uniref:hypothetical protein n=1 Tax=Roseovarius sp. THAF9 TaxID=2587847 RepID=UPI0012681A21|nr:hypothetical protein [Roseovarius sp. THAF9]QFT91410.1 hypothetical protein FIU86_01030 [Roseovarius sp. THAF9]